MLAATDFAGLAALIGAFGGLLIAGATAFVIVRDSRTTRHNTAVTRDNTTVIREGIDTLNGSTVGELLAAMETRRAESIPHDDRTVKEQEHIDEAPPTGPRQGPRR